jgi:putative ATP-binding cassette transporter
MLQLPTFMRAGVSARQLTSLKNELVEAHFRNPIPEKHIFNNIFDRLTVEGLEFNYGKSDTSFSIGPINFDIRKGETIFIYGGNGSGKTTFIHSLLGLCLPSAGEIRLNGILIEQDNYPEYKTFFSVVFSDFYLFDEILDEEHFDLAKWNLYLRLFEMEGKVTLEGSRFSTTDLSAGQRKRLALIIALMEGKPILVIDEWAADQDPYFRKKFYAEIIPLLNKKGLSIIAITHDDKYYHHADKLFKMDEGKLVEENVHLHQASLILKQV